MSTFVGQHWQLLLIFLLGQVVFVVGLMGARKRAKARRSRAAPAEPHAHCVCLHCTRGFPYPNEHETEEDYARRVPEYAAYRLLNPRKDRRR